ncbi:MAG TPA: glycosyltransferase family 4 protein [Gemmatirosa sp.]
MERAAFEVINRLKRDNHVVVVSRVCEIEGDNFEWVPVRGILYPSAAYGLTFAMAAQRAAKAAGCDMIYSIGSEALEADMVVTQFCHAAFLARYPGIRGGNRAIRRVLHSISQHGETLLERRAYGSKRLRRVLAVSGGVATDVVEHYGVSRDAVRIVPNGVDPTAFRPVPTREAKTVLRRALGLPEGMLTALFVGGDWHRKGLADVIEAVGILPDVALIVVGKGDAVTFGQIANRVGATGRVFFIPPTPRPQDYYAAADVFAFPSRYEAFSLATLEAAASGLPLITRRINGTEDLIEHGVNGFFIEDGGLEIAERIAQLRDEELRARMSAAAVEASRRYTWDAIGEQHLAALHEVVSERAAPMSAGRR